MSRRLLRPWSSGQERQVRGITAILSNTKPKTLVASKMVLLPEILGDGDSSPFHFIVTHCDASVFESKLVELIVQVARVI